MRMPAHAPAADLADIPDDDLFLDSPAPCPSRTGERLARDAAADAQDVRAGFDILQALT
jgi:hypothetical protein